MSLVPALSAVGVGYLIFCRNNKRQPTQQMNKKGSETKWRK